MLDIGALDERIAILFATPMASHVMRFLAMEDEFRTVACILVVEGRDGVFIGYGTTKGQASASAWENLRDRSGKGYPLL